MLLLDDADPLLHPPPPLLNEAYLLAGHQNPLLVLHLEVVLEDSFVAMECVVSLRELEWVEVLLLV